MTLLVLELNDQGIRIGDESVLRASSPGYVVAAGKELVSEVSGGPVSDDLILYTAELIARLRTGDEGQEGLAAFFDKRTPDWAITS